MTIESKKYESLLVVKDKDFSFLMKLRLLFKQKEKYEGLFYHATYVEHNGKAYVYEYCVNPRIRKGGESESQYWNRISGIKI